MTRWSEFTVPGADPSRPKWRGPMNCTAYDNAGGGERPDPRDAEIARLRRELADAADQIEQMSKAWRCPDQNCYAGFTADLSRPPMPIAFGRLAFDRKPCRHCARARDHVEAARRAAGVDAADPTKTPKI